MITKSILTCPKCGFQKKEEMPTNTCQYRYRCPACGEDIKTIKGECCIYCCYGDYPCPSAQFIGSSCCSPD